MLAQRYGSRAEEAVCNTLAVEAAQQLLAQGNLTSATTACRLPDSSDLLLQLTVCDLRALPDPPCESVALTRLTAAHLEQAELLESIFRRQVLDQLEDAYRFSVAPVLVNQELQTIQAAAEEQLALMADEDRRDAEAELRSIAERRVRLGAVVLEMARRFAISVSESDAQASCLPGESATAVRARLTEERVVEHLARLAHVSTRPATVDELRALSDEGDSDAG